MISSSKSSASVAVLDELAQQLGDVARVQLAGVHGIVAGRLVGPWMVTPCRTTTSSGSVSSQLPPASAARSTITEPGRMPATVSSVTRRGAGRPGTSAVVMTTSKSFVFSASSSCCRCGSLGRQRLRVAALVLGVGDAEVELEELGAEALDLLLHRRRARRSPTPARRAGAPWRSPAGRRRRRR